MHNFNFTPDMFGLTRHGMRLRTIRGYDFGEVSSSMQKAIRRGETQYAGYWALELWASGFGNYVWKRLLTISAEDCWGIITQEVKALHDSYAMINANLSGRRAKGPILQVKSHEIDEWLRKLGGAPRTRNSSLTSIRTFFSWAKSRCYLPKNEETAAEGVPKVRVGDTETGIFTPEQMGKILEAATAEIIPFIVLGAFAGLRAAEITRIEWSAIDLELRFITIRAGQAKTASRRIVPISDNLRQWLLPHVGRGLVVPSAETYRKVTNLSRRLGIEWPHNVLRHSFISYRIAKIKNANEVALEAGNSPDIIFRHYRELATEEQAGAWFAIVPPAES